MRSANPFIAHFSAYPSLQALILFSDEKQIRELKSKLLQEAKRSKILEESLHEKEEELKVIKSAKEKLTKKGYSLSQLIHNPFKRLLTLHQTASSLSEIESSISSLQETIHRKEEENTEVCFVANMNSQSSIVNPFPWVHLVNQVS